MHPTDSEIRSEDTPLVVTVSESKPTCIISANKHLAACTVNGQHWSFARLYLPAELIADSLLMFAKQALWQLGQKRLSGTAKAGLKARVMGAIKTKKQELIFQAGAMDYNKAPDDEPKQKPKDKKAIKVPAKPVRKLNKALKGKMAKPRKK